MKTILFKPFEKYSERTLFLYGILFTIVGSFIAYFFKVRFDGVLDLHVVPHTLLLSAFYDNLINIICLVLCLYLTAIYINRKTRLVDIVSTAIVSRIPFYIVPIANVNNVLLKSTEDFIAYGNPEQISQIPASSWVVILAFALLTIVFLIWYIALLYNGFRVASNAKGNLPKILFGLSLLLAEILSKILIIQFV